MFCQKCGTVLADTATACLSCSTPIVPAGLHPGGTSPAAETVRSASKDALAAFRSLAGNPVGGLVPAYQALGEARAVRAGVAFGLVSLASFLLGGYLLLPPFMKEDLFEFLGFGGVMKCLLFALIPFLCTAAGSLAVRKGFGGRGGLGSDAFVAGASLLPASLCMLAGGLVGLEHYQAIGVLTVVAGCTGTLMLFAGYTRVAKLGERAATIAVPLVILLTVWLAKSLSTSVLTGGGGGGDIPYGYPF
jgi:hypothetical protein